MFSSFGEIALSQIPRILGLGDRDTRSRTFGCFDRGFWHYRLVDFPSAWFQQACVLLALVYVGPRAGNPYAGRKELATWALAAARFWTSHLNPDGSADEAYPRERSFCATAFGALAVAETVQMLGADCPEALPRSGRWLARAGEPPIANQVAAAALALQALHEITGDREFAAGAVKKIRWLLGQQSEAGFFPEYGGYDVGYLSVTLGLLAKFYRKTGSPEILAAVQRALAFLEPLVYADGTYCVQGTSRRTQFLFPFGFAYFGSDILRRIERGLKEGRILNPLWLDDRHVTPMTTDYWEAHLLLSGGAGG